LGSVSCTSASCICSTFLSDTVSRRHPCASQSLHLHQVVKRTFTFKLSNMLGTPIKKRTGKAGALRISVWFQKSIFIANCSCRDDPESPVGKRVLEITPKALLPKIRPG